MSSYFNNYITGAGQHSPLGASPPFSPQYGDPTSPVPANSGPLSPDSGLRYSAYDRMDIHGIDMTRSHTNINNNNYYNNHTIKAEFDHNRNAGINNHGYKASSVTGGKSNLASLPCSEPYSGHRLQASVSGGGVGPASVSPSAVQKQSQQLHRQQSMGIEAVSSPSPPSTASTPQPRNAHIPLTTAIALSATNKHRNSADHSNINNNNNNNKSSSSSHNSLQSSGLQSPGGSSKGEGDDHLDSSGKSGCGESPGRHRHSDDGTGEGGDGSKPGFEVYPWMRSQFGKFQVTVTLFFILLVKNYLPSFKNLSLHCNLIFQLKYL